jgi:putative transposase
MGKPFCTLLTRLGVLQSASVRGPGDNAHAESFFHSLKAELTRGASYMTQAALRHALRRYLRYCNTVHLDSAPAYRSPLAFEHHAA